MRLMLVNYSAPILKDIVLELQKKGVKIVYWTGAKNDFDSFKKDKTLFPDTIFHDYYDAVRGIAAPGVNLDKFEVPDRNLLSRLANHESLIMPMFNRLDFKENFGAQARQRLYHEYVRYWYGVLRKYRPDAIVFSSIPHIVYNYVIYVLAKELGVRTVIHRSLQIPSRILFFQDFQTYSNLQQTYQELKDASYKFEDLSEDIRAYYKSQSAASKDLTPWYRQPKYMQKRSRQMELLPSAGGVVKSLISFDFIKKIKVFFRGRRLLSLDQNNYYSFWTFKKWQWIWRQKRLAFKKEYLSLVKAVDLDKKFIYVPLGTQPEMSTNPLGGIYDDQILMIETLARVIPHDWQIYVKETPTQWTWRFSHLGRYPGYYHKLNRIPQVTLIPIELSTYKLIRQSQAVATITGTAGLEAVLRGQPALIFGYPWFQHCEGMFRIDGEASARQAIEQIRQGYKPDQQKVINFLKALDQVSLPAYFYEKFKFNKELTHGQNVQMISEALYRELKK